MAEYDFLIVGAGLYGAIFANEATSRGKKCLVIDKRHHIAGNIYTEDIETINVHRHGPHIFHTSNKKIWDYVNNIVPFNRFTYSPIANYNNQFPVCESLVYNRINCLRNIIFTVINRRYD